MGCYIVYIVELIVIVYTQHINKGKYRNSYTISDKCRKATAWIDFAL